MEPNPDIKLYDPRAVLTRLRNQGRNDKLMQSASERTNNMHHYIPERDPIASQQNSRKLISPTSAYTQEDTTLGFERKIAMLEEENRALAHENSILRHENERAMVDKERLRERYEEEIIRLKDQIVYIEDKYKKLSETQKKLADSKTKDTLKEADLPFAKKFTSGVSPNTSRYQKKGICDLDLLLSVYKELPKLEKPVVRIDFSQELQQALQNPDDE